LTASDKPKPNPEDREFDEDLANRNYRQFIVQAGMLRATKMEPAKGRIIIDTELTNQEAIDFWVNNVDSLVTAFMAVLAETIHKISVKEGFDPSMVGIN
jgi:hypothetical protein